MPGLLVDLKVKENIFKRGETVFAWIKLANMSSEDICLKYPSGKLFDLYLLTVPDREEVWRWSEGKYFTMALIKRFIGPGEKFEYRAEIEIDPALETGNYILTGDLMTEINVHLPEKKIKII